MTRKYLLVSFVRIVTSITICFLLTLCCETGIGQTVVGMGTESPNSNAVLELFSDNHNQGFLVPRFTTTQREANSFTSQLSSADNGLLIFDIDKGKFFHWYNGEWEQGYTLDDLPANTVNWYTGSRDPDNTQGINGDFYFNTITGNLYRKANDQFIIISNLIDTKKQDLATILTQGSDAKGMKISNLGTPASAGDAVTKAYVDAAHVLAQGSILVGNSNNTGQPLDAKTSGNILVGNGTTLGSVKISGDLVLLADGTLTLNNLSVTTSKIENAAITKDKINADVAGDGLGQNADGSLEIKVAGGGIQLMADQLQLSNNEDGQLLIGSNKQVNPTFLSGDISLAGDGTVTTKGLQGRKIATVAPATGAALAWDGSQWSPSTIGEYLGNTTWYYGAGTPPNANTATAVAGDMYFNSTDNSTYAFDGSAWSPLGTMLPGGADYTATRNTGDLLAWDGIQWVPQPPTSLGSGATWYSGTATPTLIFPLLTNNGDFYYKTDTQEVYRKSGLIWVKLGKWLDSSVDIPVTYIPGNDIDPNNSLGKVGDFYIKANGDAWVKTKVNKWEKFK